MLIRYCPPFQLPQKPPNVVVNRFEASIVFINGSSAIPVRLGITWGAAIGIMDIQIIEEGKKRMLAVTVNPLHQFLIHRTRTLSHPIGAAKIAGAFGVLIQPRL